MRKNERVIGSESRELLCELTDAETLDRGRQLAQVDGEIGAHGIREKRPLRSEERQIAIGEGA